MIQGADDVVTVTCARKKSHRSDFHDNRMTCICHIRYLFLKHEHIIFATMKMVLIQPLTTQQPLVQNEENDDNDPIDEKTELSSEELVRLLDAETLPQNFLDQLHRKFQAKKDFPRESHQKMLTKLLKLDFREEIDIWIDTLVCCADGALRLFFLMLEYVHQIARKELSSDVLEGCLEGFRLLIFGKAYSVDRGSVETARGPIFVAQDSDAEGDDFQYEHLSVKLLLLPGVLSNACQATKFPLPKWCATKSYVCHVLEASTHSTQICKCLAAKVSRRQGGRTISKAWFSSLQNSTDSNPSIWWDAVSSLSRHETAVILTYLLQRGVRCQKCRLVNPAVLNALAMDGDIAASFVQVSILSNIGILEDPEQDIIFVDTVVELLSGIGGDQEVLRSCTLPVSYVWSQPATVGDFAPELQHHLSHFLAKSLDVLKIKDPLSEIFSQSAIGVTFRLNSSILEVRMDAMRIGTLVAESAGLEVNFEELASQGRGTSGNLLTETQSLANSKSDKCLEKVTRHDSDSESDGSLEPYYLDSDEEDLSEVPRPRYLSDCVELLSVSDKEDNAFDSHRIALTVLPSIIESGPIDLPDMSASVARRLLRLENHFSMPEFGQLIRSSLIKLVIADPDRAGGALVHEVFTGLCLSNRGEALCALTDAAFELSGLGDLRRRQDSGG